MHRNRTFRYQGFRILSCLSPALLLAREVLDGWQTGRDPKRSLPMSAVQSSRKLPFRNTSSNAGGTRASRGSHSCIGGTLAEILSLRLELLHARLYLASE